MAIPLIVAPLPHFLKSNTYVSASLAADPHTASLAAAVDEADAGLRATVFKRNLASDAVVRMDALRDSAFIQVGRDVASLERKLEAHFDGKGAAYQAVMEFTPAVYAAAPEKDRERMFKKLLAAAAAPELPAPLHAAGKTLLSSWQKYLDAEAAVTTTEAAFDAAVEVETAAKQKCIVTLREVQGRLQIQFPNDLKRVASYFPKAKRPKSVRQQPVGDTTVPDGDLG